MRARAAAVAALAPVLAALPAAALADGAVAEMLEETGEAEFRGSGIVMCSWDGDSAATANEVTRSGGMSMVEGPGGATMSYGTVAAVRSGSGWTGTDVEQSAEWAVGDRYTLGEARDTVRLGRPAVMVTILDEGSPRVRMILDAATRVPLGTEVLDGEGGVYRMSALVTFDAGAQARPDEMPERDDMGMAHSTAAAASLPESAHGYLRADVYEAGPGTVQAFYTDGLFSFSVFESPRGKRPDVFASATEIRLDGHRYRRVITPTAVWVHWDAPDRSYVLIGDLPPDHLLAVLDRFPEPGERGFLVRLWRILFG